MIHRSALPLLFSVSICCAANWPEWRGPSAQGHASASGLPDTWSETSNVAWKTPLPGRGHSTPVMWGGQIWMTTAIEKAATPEETQRRLESNTGDQPLVVLSSVSLHALCVDGNSGKLLHDIEMLNVKDPQWAHQLNSYASPTPLIEEGRLYAHFGSFGTVALDTKTLKLLWKNAELQVMHENGPGSTAVLSGDRLIAHFDGSDQQFIAAFDKNTGKLAWKTPRSGEMDPRPQQRKAYGTPLIVTINGQPQVVSSAANNIYGYHPQTGQELWKIHYGELGFSMSTVPVADDQQIYFSTAFGKSAVIALKHAGVKTPEVTWRNNKNAPKMCSPVLHDGLLFYIDDGGIVSCVDTKTGEALYRERLGGKFSASPILADGKLYFCSREGVVTIVPAAKEFKILAQNTLDGPIMASPIADGSALFIRTDKALYKIGK
ncbi:MAG: PQQ-binding-like beta-propeller repeat protein [Prosthecobacter sp.]|jgi:outer membrane protein assembly factor BamB|uniref:outer membrane protein assembly factor BamB family protein n=1 Tax=Prosthecobacter sp. TaxID=1965333 RepID=UPI0019FCD052|nr:PQQ-binding-like beta-propeller repeat protein [Prosthecobacter sp.]MBE2287847.1 PQQ-binding-like beta-propeller repeat protein [Prosthecobacter sp.]